MLLTQLIIYVKSGETMSGLKDLPNIGEQLAKRLESIGIDTPEKLRSIGSISAVMALNDTLGKGCYNTLYALEGAIRGYRWHNLPKEDRDSLKTNLESTYFGRG